MLISSLMSIINLRYILQILEQSIVDINSNLISQESAILGV